MQRVNLHKCANSALILYCEVTVDDGIWFASPQTFAAVVIVDGRSKLEE